MRPPFHGRVPAPSSTASHSVRGPALSKQPSLQGEAPSLLKVGRRPPEPRGFFRRMPVSLRYGLPMAVAGVLVVAFWPQIRELARRL